MGVTRNENGDVVCCICGRELQTDGYNFDNLGEGDVVACVRCAAMVKEDERLNATVH